MFNSCHVGFLEALSTVEDVMNFINTSKDSSTAPRNLIKGEEEKRVHIWKIAVVYCLAAFGRFVMEYGSTPKKTIKKTLNPLHEGERSKNAKNHSTLLLEPIMNGYYYLYFYSVTARYKAL